MSTYTFFPPGDQSLVMSIARLLRRCSASASTAFIVAIT